MKRGLWLFLIILPIVTAIDATTCEQADVQSAMDSASDGDIVNIPPGTCIWNSYVTVSKEISIIGSGTNIIDYGFYIPAGTNNWRISGINWSTSSGITAAIRIAADPSLGYNKKMSDGSDDFRIDHCVFTGYSRSLYINGGGRGLIDNNEFYRQPNGIYVFGTVNTAWSGQVVYGSGDFIFFEDNVWDTKGVANSHAILMHWGAKVVVRHNLFTESGGFHSSATVDAHNYGSGPRGTRAYEVYENIFEKNEADCCKGMLLRSGSGRIFNNTFGGNYDYLEKNIVLAEYRVTNYPAISSISSGCENNPGNAEYCPPEDGGEGYPCCDQIGRGMGQELEPMYIWNNDNAREAGDNDATIMVQSSKYETDYIVEGRDYYLCATQDECESRGMPAYTPYPYPHPMRSEAVCVPMPIVELMGFMDAWKSGSHTIQQVMEAITRWKNGC